MYITVGFSTTRKWRPLSWAIKFVEKTEYSHVYLKFRSDKLAREFIYQASDDNLNFMNMQMFLKKNIVVEEYIIPVSPEEKRAIMQYCIDTIGIPYGKVQLVGMGLVRLSRIWFNRKIANPFKDGEKTQVCLELVGRALKILGAHVDEEMLEEGGLVWMNEIVRKFSKKRQNTLAH